MVDEPQYGSGSVEDPDAHDPKKTALGARLRAARMHVAMTQEDLAARVQRKKNWLSDIERGRRGIDPHTLQEIAQITGRPVEYFTNPRFKGKGTRNLRYITFIYPDSLKIRRKDPWWNFGILTALQWSL